jgi:hypothetical protein
VVPSSRHWLAKTGSFRDFLFQFELYSRMLNCSRMKSFISKEGSVSTTWQEAGMPDHSLRAPTRRYWGHRWDTGDPAGLENRSWEGTRPILRTLLEVARPRGANSRQSEKDPRLRNLFFSPRRDPIASSRGHRRFPVRRRWQRVVLPLFSWKYLATDKKVAERGWRPRRDRTGRRSVKPYCKLFQC